MAFQTFFQPDVDELEELLLEDLTVPPVEAAKFVLTGLLFFWNTVLPLELVVCVT
jgi:hypothetical protein